MISRTMDSGTANGCSRRRTISTGRIASVSGRVMVKVEPCPITERTSMRPLSLRMLVRTTSMPTPRPETLEI
jgi:hypothetical protein